MQLFYDLSQTASSGVWDFITSLEKAGANGIQIDPEHTSLSISQIIEISAHLAGKMELIIVNDVQLATEAKAQFLKLDFANISINNSAAKKNGLTVVGAAKTVADIKNWELQGVDIIDFQLNGNNAEVFSTFFPKKQAYGWSLLSLNSALRISHPSDFDQLETVLKNVAIGGVTISDHFEPGISRDECVRRLSKLFH